MWRQLAGASEKHCHSHTWPAGAQKHQHWHVYLQNQGYKWRRESASLRLDVCVGGWQNGCVQDLSEWISRLGGQRSTRLQAAICYPRCGWSGLTAGLSLHTQNSTQCWQDNFKTCLVCVSSLFKCVQLNRGICNGLVGWVKSVREANALLYLVCACVRTLPVKHKHEGGLARSTDTFQNTGDRSCSQTRAGTTLRKSLREREWEREGHRRYKLTVCMSVGLSNYRLAWCVEPRVYHNTAQVMTPYTTHTCKCVHIHTHTHNNNNCTKHLNSCFISPFPKTTHIFKHTFQATQWYKTT